MARGQLAGHAQALRAGREVEILLPLGVGLRHGDVLLDDERSRVVVNIVPCPVLVVRPKDVQEMGVLACELGNLHVPVEVTPTELVVLSEGPTLEVLRRYQASYEKQVRRFAPLRASVITRPRLADSFQVTQTDLTENVMTPKTAPASPT